MLSVDRFEGDFVICIDENGNAVNLPMGLIPEGTEEGDILTSDENGLFKIDTAATEKKKCRFAKRLEMLAER